jgi:hypothetical protein
VIGCESGHQGRGRAVLTCSSPGCPCIRIRQEGFSTLSSGLYSGLPCHVCLVVSKPLVQTSGMTIPGHALGGSIGNMRIDISAWGSWNRAYTDALADIDRHASIGGAMKRMGAYLFWTRRHQREQRLSLLSALHVNLAGTSVCNLFGLILNTRVHRV